MSGLPTNNPLGNLLGGIIGSLGQNQLQSTGNAGAHWARLHAASLAQQVAQASYPPNRPSMTGTEFIKASLRVAMEREIVAMFGICSAVGSASTVLCLLIGAIVFHFTHAWPLGFVFGIPAAMTGVTCWMLFRRKMKKWIEVHLS